MNKKNKYCGKSLDEIELGVLTGWKRWDKKLEEENIHSTKLIPTGVIKGITKETDSWWYPKIHKDKKKMK